MTFFHSTQSQDSNNVPWGQFNEFNEFASAKVYLDWFIRGGIVTILISNGRYSYCLEVYDNLKTKYRSPATSWTRS